MYGHLFASYRRSKRRYPLISVVILPATHTECVEAKDDSLKGAAVWWSMAVSRNLRSRVRLLAESSTGSFPSRGRRWSRQDSDGRPFASGTQAARPLRPDLDCLPGKPNVPVAARNEGQVRRKFGPNGNSAVAPQLRVMVSCSGGLLAPQWERPPHRIRTAKPKRLRLAFNGQSPPCKASSSRGGSRELRLSAAADDRGLTPARRAVTEPAWSAVCFPRSKESRRFRHWAAPALQEASSSPRCTSKKRGSPHRD